jgi:hypothetical protein
MNWINDNSIEAQFGDVRLTKRLNTIVEKLTKNPETTLPEAMGKWSETKAAYRFFDNENVEVSAIYEAQRAESISRIKAETMILAVEDTTIFNYTLQRGKKGLGPIGTSELSGFFLHSSLAVSTAGVPLGNMGCRMWVRPPESKDSRKTHKKRPLENKESFRWIDIAREVADAVPAPTKVVTVGDRESDIYDLLILALDGYDFLIRAAWNRRLNQSKDYLWQAAENAPILGSTSVVVPRKDEKAERTATVTLQSVTVTINPPQHRMSEKLPTPTVNALLIKEISCPEDCTPLEWLLLTTLPVCTFEDALQCMIWYSYRWRIERFHYILKSGCKVEQLQLETKDRLMRALAVFSIVAFRLLWLTYQARLTPDLPCTAVFIDCEWRTLFTAVNKSCDFPDVPPSLATAVLWVAFLGRFLGRKHDGSPGVHVLWRGIRRLFDLASFAALSTYG